MLIVLEVSPLACKRAFYRPEHNGKQRPKELNFTVIKIRKWNIPTVRAQRVDFTPNVTNESFFLYFLLMTAENLSQSGAKYLEHLKDLVKFFIKWYGRWALELPFVRYWGLKYQKNCWVSKKYQIPVFPMVDGCSEPDNL